MAPLVRLLTVGLLFAAFLAGQTLKVSVSETDRKKPGTFTVMLESPPGKPISALQWEFSVPPAIEVETTGIAAGKAASAAGKSVACAKKAGGNGAVRYACILTGGTDSLRNGAVAVVQYRAGKDVGGAPVRVAIENVLGVSPDLKRLPIPNTDAIIRIR